MRFPRSRSRVTRERRRRRRPIVQLIRRNIKSREIIGTMDRMGIRRPVPSSSSSCSSFCAFVSGLTRRVHMHCIADQQRPEHSAEREAGAAMERHEGRDRRSDQCNDRHDLRRGRGLLRTGRLLLRRGHSRPVPQHTYDQLRKWTSASFYVIF